MPGIRFVAVSTAITTGLLTIAGSAVLPAGPQTATATAEQITAYYAEHTDALQLSIVFWSIAAASLLVFSGVTSALLRRTGAAAELATVCAGAGCVAAALMLTAQGPMAVGAREDFTAADDATRRTIYVLADVTYSLGDLVLPAAGLLIGALSLAAFRRTLLPRWLGYLGTPVAAAAVLGAIAPLHGEHVGVFEILEVAAYMLWPLWIIATGITLAVRGKHPLRPATAVAAR
ncbi:MAG TPA: DUF4386 family protein [Jiangellales bacterium]|nr:DUF4386 family protein [Jiangellales bacterium]